MSKWVDSTHGVQPGTNFKQVPPEDYYRAMQCVNALVSVSEPEMFVWEATQIRKDNGLWHNMMQELLGENTLSGAHTLITELKVKASIQRSLDNITERDRDNLCDMLWWLKGYYKGANDNFENCPFQQDHLDTLNKVVFELREILNLMNKK